MRHRLADPGRDCRRVGCHTRRIGQIVPAACRRWAEMGELAEVTDEILALVVDNGGVMAVGELDALLVESRGSGLRLDAARRAACAVARAAIGADKVTPEDTGGIGCWHSATATVCWSWPRVSRPRLPRRPSPTSRAPTAMPHAQPAVTPTGVATVRACPGAR